MFTEKRNTKNCRRVKFDIKYALSSHDFCGVSGPFSGTDFVACFPTGGDFILSVALVRNTLLKGALAIPMPPFCSERASLEE